MYWFEYFYLQRWYVDGDIQCFTGGHIPLALFAMLTLALCVAIVPTLVIVSLKVNVSATYCSAICSYPREGYHILFR